MHGEDRTLGAGQIGEHTHQAAVALGDQRRVIERMLEGAATSDAQRVPEFPEALARRFQDTRDLGDVLDGLEQAVADARSMARTIARAGAVADWEPRFREVWVAILARAADAVRDAATAPQRGRASFDPWPRTFGFHEIFHALVIAAAVTHFVAIAGWVILPAG